MSSYNYKYTKIDLTQAKKLGNNGGSFWQSGLWAQILEKTGQASDMYWVHTDSHGFLVERRRIFRSYSGLYLLGTREEISNKFLTFIQKEITTSHDLFLQIEPLLSREERKKQKEKNKAPFRRFIEPVTALLDLTTPKDELMASFAEKGRYNIRLAQKRGVRTRWVRASKACNDEGRMTNDEGQKVKTYIETFYELLEETTTRDGFSSNSLSYYRHFVETLESENAGGLLVAEKDGVLHAAGIFAYCGDTAIYYYGASSSDREIRRDMATYLLQWDAIREGIQRKCSTYDFLGISEDGKGKLAGVTEFKLRFNPEKKYWPSEKIIIYKPFSLSLLKIISKLRKIFR